VLLNEMVDGFDKQSLPVVMGSGPVRNGIRGRGDAKENGTLLRRLLQRRDPRQDDLNPRAAAGLGIEVQPAAEPVGDDAVDDMQAKPGAALIPARGEERIEGAAPRLPSGKACATELRNRLVSTWP
jgi:hypothetical protein